MLSLDQPQVGFLQIEKAGIPSRLISGTWSKRALCPPKRGSRDSVEPCARRGFPSRQGAQHSPRLWEGPWREAQLVVALSPRKRRPLQKPVQPGPISTYAQWHQGEAVGAQTSGPLGRP